MTIIQKEYACAKEWLSRHKKLSILLSHGFLHLVILLVLCVLGCILALENFKSSPSQIRYITIAVGDSIGTTEMKDFHLSALLSVDSIKNKGKANIFIAYTAQKKDSRYKDSLGIRPYVAITQPSNYNTTDKDQNNEYRYGLNDRLLFKKMYEDKSKSPLFILTNANPSDTNLFLSSPEINYTGNSFFDIENPYYRVHIKLSSEHIYHDIDSTATILIRFPKEYVEGEPSFAQIIRAQPTPTRIGLNSILYTGRDVKEAFNDGGLLIEAQDAEKVLKAERKSMLFSVLIGTIIAFCLDIMIQLIYKWRRLQPTKSEDTPKNNKK